MRTIENQLRKACLDLDERLRSGDDASAEDYRSTQPELWASDDAALELIFTEIVVRGELGNQYPTDTWYRRYPQWQDRIGRLLEIQGALEAEVAEEDTTRQDNTRTDVSLARDFGQGRQVRGYELLQEIDRGGMGVVYKARQTGLNRIVAIKMILAGAHASETDLRRFRREAEAAARLQHPNVVQIHEIGEADGVPFLSMEFVDGVSLDGLLSDWQAECSTDFTPTYCAQLVQLLAEAIDFAHRQGIVHRDLKPANILLSKGTVKLPKGTVKLPKGTVKIADFGLAKILDATAGTTHSGALLGTPSYMAPEQTIGNQSDMIPAVDIYALGAILYEMLTGRPPLQGSSTVETLQMVRDYEPVPPSRLRIKVPRDLETICLKCLEKEPQRRYASAAALAKDLERYLEGAPIHARRADYTERAVKWIRRRPAIAGLSALLVSASLIGLGGIVWQWNRAELNRQAAVKALAETEGARKAEKAQRERLEAKDYFHRIALARHELATHNVARAERLLDECDARFRHWEWHYLRGLCRPELLRWDSGRRESRGIAISPDGRYLASTDGQWGTTTPGEIRVWQAATGRLDKTLRGHSGPVFGVAFSPDGRRLVSASSSWAAESNGDGVKLWDLTTGREVDTFSGPFPDAFAVAFSPDGKLLAAGCTNGTVIVRQTIDGSERLKLSGHSDSVFGVVFSPDGHQIASGSRDGTVRMWTTDGNLICVLRATEDVRSLAFSPEGSLLAAGTFAGAVCLWDIQDEPIQKGTYHPDIGPIQGIAFSPDSRWIALAGFSGAVHIWDPWHLAEVRRLMGHDGPAHAVAFAREGEYIASAGMDGAIKLWNLTDDPNHFEHHLRSIVARIAFSPDSRFLALAGKRDQSWNSRKCVHIWNVGSRQPVSDFAGHTDWLTWIDYNPDGTRLASASLDHTVRIWDAGSGGVQLVLTGHSGPVTTVAFSPNGHRLASGSTDQTVRIWDAQTGVELLSIRPSTCWSDPEEGTEAQAKPMTVTGVSWDPDGKHLTLATDQGAVSIWNVDTDREVVKFRVPEGSVHRVLFSPDGRRLAAVCNQTIHLWDTSQLPTVSPISDQLTGHTQRINDLAFSPDGNRIASVSDDRTLRLWDSATGHQAVTIGWNNRPLDCVAFSPDGHQLAVANGRVLKIYSTGPARKTLPKPWSSAWVTRKRAWHEQSLLECALAGRWPGVEFHADRLMEDGQGDSRYIQRARARAELADWEAFELDLQLAAEAASHGATDTAYQHELAYRYYQLGKVLRRSGRMAAAEESFRRSIQKYQLAMTHADNRNYLRDRLARAWGRYAGLLWTLGRREHAEKAYRNTIAVWEQLVDGKRDDARHCNVLSWHLATVPFESLRDPGRAVLLAERAVELQSAHGEYWNTLGVAHYYNGNDAAALEAFQKAMALRDGGNSFDWFFLAMVHAKRGQIQKARHWYERANDWMEEHGGDEDVLYRIRAEASALLAAMPNSSNATVLPPNYLKRTIRIAGENSTIAPHRALQRCAHDHAMEYSRHTTFHRSIPQA